LNEAKANRLTAMTRAITCASCNVSAGIRGYAALDICDMCGADSGATIVSDCYEGQCWGHTIPMPMHGVTHMTDMTLN